MAKSLIIAEKPSVAADIARALGGFTRHDDYFESDRYVLSSAVGHLLELGMPEEEEVKRGKWTFAHLPAIPSKFALKPIEKAESRLKMLLKLLNQQRTKFAHSDAKPWELAANDPDNPPMLPNRVTPADAAAWTVVARVH